MNPMGKKELRIMVRIKLAMSRATEAYTHEPHGGFAYAHGAVRGVQPLPAGDGGNDEAESKSLDQGYDDVPMVTNLLMKCIQ